MSLKHRITSALRPRPFSLALVVAAVCLGTVPKAFAQG